MCGRFANYTEIDEILNWDNFEYFEDHNLYTPSFNFAPMQECLAIAKGKSKLRLGFLKWGLMPSWARKEFQPAKLINARSETVYEKPSYQNLIGRRHCAIPLNGYYEWDKSKNTYWVEIKNNPLYTVAALWDVWEFDGVIQKTFTILTTEATNKLNYIHHRQPICMNKIATNEWLDTKNFDMQKLQYHIRIQRTLDYKITKVSGYVNNVKNQGPRCIEAANKLL
ncbi:MAG: SOS response-associated peptidase [Lentisphaeria bacterium]|nr:SOS response-associated peptidase [Lentisphaeria bacterium]